MGVFVYYQALCKQQTLRSACMNMQADLSLYCLHQHYSDPEELFAIRETQ